MKRTAGTLVMLAALGGCTSTQHGPDAPPWMGGGAASSCPSCQAQPSIPGMVGPGGAPVAMTAPYMQAPFGNPGMAQAMMANGVPTDMIQQAGYQMPGGGMPGMPPGGMMTMGGMPPGMGGMPGGMGGMPGGMGGMLPPPPSQPPGVVASVGALTGQPTPWAVGRTEVRFAAPNGMKISWFTPGPDGRSAFAGSPIEVPGRYNFVQAAIYRLKLSDIPNRPGLELYPTLEVVPGNAKTAAFLAHSAVPLAFTEEDFEQVTSGNYVVKVIYLPDQEYQDLAATGGGPDVLVSSRLEPGVDPVAVAHSRGSILLIIRMGNIDLEAPNTPAMDAPSPYAPRPYPPMAGPGMMNPRPGMGGGLPPYPGLAGMPGVSGPGPYGPMGPGGPNFGTPTLPNPVAPSGPGGFTPPAPTPATPPAGSTGPSSKAPSTSGVQQTSAQTTTSTSLGSGLSLPSH